jgi:malate dehydrogenase (oxaloacetate-decarboxylating)(NADP+)
MLIAATEALRTLVHQNDELALKFGPTYILPKPFDPRLLKKIPQAVARAAKETGAARP